MKRKIIEVAFPFLLLLTLANNVLASGGDSHGGGGMLGIDWRVILVQAFGFAVVFWVLKRYLFGPLSKIMDQRREHIRGTLEKIEGDRSEMENLKSDYQARIANIESEARLKIQDAVKRAEEIGDEIKATRREEAEKMIEKARREIVREQEKSLISLRREIADLALQMSAKLIRSELDKEKHRDLISCFIDELDTKVDAEVL